MRITRVADESAQNSTRHVATTCKVLLSGLRPSYPLAPCPESIAGSPGCLPATPSPEPSAAQPLPRPTGPRSPEGHGGLDLVFLGSLLTSQPPGRVDSWGPSCILLPPVTLHRCPLRDAPPSSEPLRFMGCPPFPVPRCPCGRVTAGWKPGHTADIQPQPLRLALCGRLPQQSIRSKAGAPAGAVEKGVPWALRLTEA